MTAKPEKTWFGQPRGLTILFLTNMWESFSYYGMRALLVYYMTKQLLFPQGKASLIYGSYVGLAYFTPILGGIIADQWLGKRRAVIAGGSIMALGHFLMTFVPLFYVALATIAIGNGLFLPSLPSQINDLYRSDDPRRARAYNIYYVGVNLGGFLAPFVCGTLGELFGWHYGFGAAGVGMLCGVAIYLGGRKYLPSESRKGPVIPSEVEGSRCATGKVITAGFLDSARDDDGVEQRRDSRSIWWLLLGVGIAATIFRGAYEQSGNTVALWTDSGVDRSLGGTTIPMTWFQSLNPLLVILLTPPLLFYWRRKTEAGKQITAAGKMATGALIVASAFLILAVCSRTANRAAWPWLVLFYVVLTVGELYVLPTGLGLFAKLAPPRLGATTVAAWFLTIFSGSTLAGAIGVGWSHTSRQNFFLILSGVAATAAVLLFLLNRPLHACVRESEEAPVKG